MDVNNASVARHPKTKQQHKAPLQEAQANSKNPQKFALLGWAESSHSGKTSVLQGELAQPDELKPPKTDC
jgi:hypothetical protein